VRSKAKGRDPLASLLPTLVLGASDKTAMPACGAVSRKSTGGAHCLQPRFSSGDVGGDRVSQLPTTASLPTRRPRHASAIRHRRSSSGPDLSGAEHGCGQLRRPEPATRGVVQNGRFMGYTESGQSRANQGIPRFACNPDLNHAPPIVAAFPYGGFARRALRRASVSATGGPCRTMLLSAIGACRRMMALETSASSRRCQCRSAPSMRRACRGEQARR